MKKRKCFNAMTKFYICDKKPGACSGWDKGWKNVCRNELCFHTSNKAHRKYRFGKMLKTPFGDKFQVKGYCDTLHVGPCVYCYEDIYCLSHFCIKRAIVKHANNKKVEHDCFNASGQSGDKEEQQPHC